MESQGGLTTHCSRPPGSMAFIVVFSDEVEGRLRSVGG